MNTNEGVFAGKWTKSTLWTFLTGDVYLGEERHYVIFVTSTDKVCFQCLNPK